MVCKIVLLLLLAFSYVGLWLLDTVELSFPSLPVEVQVYSNWEFAYDEPALFSVCWYSRPYPGFFYVLTVLEGGRVRKFRHVPDWAIQAAHEAKLNEEEVDEVRMILEDVKRTQIPTKGRGKSVIVVGFSSPADGRIVCTEIECPDGIRRLFEIADGAFKRESERGISHPFSEQE